MLFSKSKNQEKNGPFVVDATHPIEEETVRRWRDIAAQRNQRNLFDDAEEDLNYRSPHAVAAEWPSAKPAEIPNPFAGIGSGMPIDDFDSSYSPASEFEEFETAQHFEQQSLEGHTIELRDDSYSEDEMLETAPTQHQGIFSHHQAPTAVTTESTLMNHRFADSSLEIPEAQATMMSRPAPQQAAMIPPKAVAPAPEAKPSAILSDLSLPIEQDLKRRFGTNIKSALGPGTVIEGTFRFDSPVCVDGTLTGEITSTSALIVGADANINGTIKVGSLIVLGTVNGSVDATELVEIRKGGMLDGDLNCQRIVIEDGGWFEGRVTMREAE